MKIRENKCFDLSTMNGIEKAENYKQYCENKYYKVEVITLLGNAINIVASN